MSDPLAGAATDAVSDAQTVVTSTYVPLLLGALLFAIVLRIAMNWMRRAAWASTNSEQLAHDRREAQFLIDSGPQRYRDQL